jgi:ribosomal protein S18 acetylase RimI-like enzyme
MKYLDTGSLEDLMELQNIVAASLPCPEIFILHEDEYFKEALCLDRSVLGITADEKLIAFSVIRIPGLSHENLGRDINLDMELGNVAHLQAAAVHPAYRGNGLQRKLTLAHLDVILEMGYQHACCTVSPKNPISLGNYLSCGLKIEGLCPKRNGWWRFILHKKILQANPFPGTNCIERMQAKDGDHSASQRKKRAIAVREIAILDIEGQLDLLGKGFKGFGISSNSDSIAVSYARF